MKDDFVVKVGHVSVIAFIINTLTEVDERGKVIKGLDKATARITGDISEILAITEPIPVTSMEEPFAMHGEFTSLHLRWIREQVNAIFDAKLMPLQFSKYALDIADNWE